MPERPAFFATPKKWRAWLQRHHVQATELWVGFHKKGSGKPSITWSESVDGALCYGWIDGIRKSLDATSYVIRFTPRKARSIWSAVNIRRFGELERLGLVRAAGRRAFEARTGARSSVYAYEQDRHVFPPAYARELKANRAAWTYFSSRPPGYRRVATWWVISAKLEATRRRRLAALIADSAAGRLIGPLTRKPEAR